MRKGKFALAALAAVAWLTFTTTAAAAPSAPLPGGKYVGETKKRAGERIVVKARSASRTGAVHGVVRYPCAAQRAAFRSDDGTFVARVRRHGRTVFKAEGSFRRMNRAVGEVSRLARSQRHGACRPSGFRTKLDNAPRIKKTTIEYGPFTVKPGMGHHGGLNTARNDIERPCEDCTIVGMLPDLRESDGSRGNYDTASMLHHVVLFSDAASDATCGKWPERFFAAGNERSPFLLPRGYGYPVAAGDHWSLVTHLMNMSDAPKDLTIKMSFYYVEGSASLAPVKPFWVDIDNCGNSEYATPAGTHVETRDFVVPPELAGRVVALGGHLHDYGRRIMLRERISGDTICSAKADYGNDPSYMGHVDTVGGCLGRNLARLQSGEELRLASRYHAPKELDGVMGIMVGYVAGAG